MKKNINLGYNSMYDWSSTRKSTFADWMHADPEYKKEIADNPPDEVILGGGQIFTLIIDYPLTNPFEEKFMTPPEGLTRIGLFTHIASSYKKIYKEEDEEVGDPGMIPGMMNRQTSDGKYGIWGHGLGDLVLHTAYLEDGNIISVGVDS